MSTTRDALRHQREQIVRAHESAENAGDVEATLATFLRPRYDLAPAGVFDGTEAVRTLLQGIFAAIPDFHSRTTRIYHADDAVIVESETTGTHTGGELFGIPPRGRRMQMRAVSIYAFEGAHMVCETMYFDAATLRAQLALED